MEKNSCLSKKVMETRGKKVYQRPSIVSEEVFETLALACCKSSICRRYGFPRGLHGVS